jgi:homoserine O-succinyltransferase
VVIPAVNEARNLAHLLPAIGSDIFEVILVDGGSTDGTIEVFRELLPDGRVLRQARKGKGEALATGFAACRGDLIVTLDADCSADPAEIPRFVEALLDGADYAKGTRFALGGGSDDITRFRQLGNWGLVQLVNLLYGTRFSDLCYGMNAFWTRCLPVVTPDCDGFEVEAFINCRAARGGLRIREVGSHEAIRRHGISNLHTIRDGFRVLRTILHEWGWGRPTSGVVLPPAPVPSQPAAVSLVGVPVASAASHLADWSLNVAAGPRSSRLRVGLVNNMPDPAFEETERQFESLISKAAGDARVELSRYWLPGIPRGPQVTDRMRQRYLPHHALRDAGLDALVISGTEPLAGRIQDEPHYRALAEVIEWGVGSLSSLVVSCLAAHAAVHWLDGIERRLLPAKCFGLERGRASADSPLSRALPEDTAIPHSHWNTVGLDQLVGHGYRPVLTSDGEWTVVEREVGDCHLVLIQGHPEYDHLTLLREYRRDWNRYRSAATLPLPKPPAGYFAPAADDLIASLMLAEQGRDRFPTHELAPLVQGSWEAGAEILYRNWLQLVRSRRVTGWLPAVAVEAY